MKEEGLRRWGCEIITELHQSEGSIRSTVNNAPAEIKRRKPIVLEVRLPSPFEEVLERFITRFNLRRNAGNHYGIDSGKTNRNGIGNSWCPLASWKPNEPPKNYSIRWIIGFLGCLRQEAACLRVL
jgi:hypothetical protein